MKTSIHAWRPIAVACLMAFAASASSQEANDASRRPASERLAPGQVGSLQPLNCNGEPAVPSDDDVPIGKSTLLKLPEPAINRSLGNPNVAQAMLVSPDTLYLLGVSVGTTNMIVQGKSRRCSVIDVAVTMDATGLANTLRELLPDEKDIRVTAAADSLVLSGTVSDAVAVQRAYELALAYVRRPAVMSAAAQQEGMANTSGGQTQTQASASIMLQQQRIVNMLTVAAAQQVMLEVKIAEVSKTLIDKLGARLNGSLSGGMWSYQLLSNFLSGTLGGTVGATRSATTGLTLEAEKRDGLVKVLAEPNVMAISGQEGSFLAGGKILIPVAQACVERCAAGHLAGKGFRCRPEVHADRAVRRAHQPAGRAGSLRTRARRRRHQRHQQRGADLPADYHAARRDHGAAGRRPELCDRRADQEQHDDQHPRLPGPGRDPDPGRAVSQ